MTEVNPAAIACSITAHVPRVIQGSVTGAAMACCAELREELRRRTPPR